jgi:hypothetical protein
MCPNCSGLNVIKLKEIFDTCSSIIDSMFYENACALGIEDECY